MIKRFLVLALMALCLFPRLALGQGVSLRDTVRVVNNKAVPGAHVSMKVYVANDSASLLGLSLFFVIDTNVVKFVSDQDSGDVHTDLINRGLPPDGVHSVFDFVPLQMSSTDSIHAALIAAGTGSFGFIPVGRGNVFQFTLRIKPNVPMGTTTQIRLYNPIDIPPNDDKRTCQFTDETGLITIEPTLINGTLEVDTGSTPVDHNQPPVVSVPSSPVAAQPNQLVSFNVTATDPDGAQHVTLTGSGIPSGATFGNSLHQVSGNAPVIGSFSWTPTLSQSGRFFDLFFNCTDDSGGVAVQKTIRIEVGSVQPTNEDVLFTGSSETYKDFRGGIPGATGIQIPVDLADINAVYGVQFDFVYDQNVMIIDSLTPTERLENFTIYDNVGGSPGRVRVVAFGLNNEKVVPGDTSGTSIFRFWATAKPGATPGKYPIDFENAWEASSPDPAAPSVKLKFDTTGVFIIDQFGDVNGDGRVDVADAVVTVAYIIGDQSLSTRSFDAADIDGNDVVDVVDLVAIINIIFGGTPPTSPAWSGPEAIVKLGDDNGLVNGSAVDVNADLPTDIAGVQLEISYNPAKLSFMTPQRTNYSANLNFRFRDNGKGRLVVLLYPTSRADSKIAAGAVTVMRLPLTKTGDIATDGKDLRITSATLSDPNAVGIPVKGLAKPNVPGDFTLNQNYPNPFNPETTIEFAVGTGAAAKPVRLEVFNVLGQKIATLIDKTLAAGKYTYRWQGRTESGESASSGVYFYRLTIGDQAQTKKMVLLK